MRTRGSRVVDQAEIHRMAKSKNVVERKKASEELKYYFAILTDKKQAWDDLHRLTSDNNSYVRWGAADALVSMFSHVPDINQAWDDLHGLTFDNDSYVRRIAADALGSVFSNVPDRIIACEDLIRLTYDNYSYVRSGAAYSLGSVFSNVPNKTASWESLHRLTSDNDSYVRRVVAGALGSVFSFLTYKNQAWEDLQRMSSDNEENVRASAFHSMGKASIFKAGIAENNEDLKKEMEIAIGYFEKSSRQGTYAKPAKFCLPFYRSLYMLTFKKGEHTAEVENYLIEAKSAIEYSESKEKLLEAVENLGNALKEVLKALDFDIVKSDLNTYRKYCERAADMLDDVDDKVPGAAHLVRKGLPIIDERIKAIIAEIQDRAKALCKQVKDTEFREIGLQANEVGQELSKVIDPIRLEKMVRHMLIPLTAICGKMHEEDRGEACEILKQINIEQNVEDKLPLISMFLSKISTQMNKVINVGNITIEKSNNVQVNVGTGNKQVQVSKNSKPKTVKKPIKKSAYSFDEKIEEKDKSIKKILDIWGLKPKGYHRDEKKAAIEKWLHRFQLSEFEDAFLILERIQYHDSHTVDGYMEGLSRELKKIFNNDLSEILFYPLGESPASSGGNLLYSYRRRNPISFLI